MFPGRRRGEISITFMSGPLDGKVLSFEQPELGRQRIITIGRRAGCDVMLDFDNQVSRLHARVGCVARPVTATDTTTAPMILSFWLEDGGSRNGTFIEKNPDPLKERIPLRPSTLFRVGRTWLRLDVPLSYG